MTSKRPFGSVVARHVEGCTDTFEDPKPDWKPRKQAYLDRLPSESPATRLISAADKLHNAKAILADFRLSKHDLWERFNSDRGEQIWYFRELVRVFEQAGTNRIVQELGRVVNELVREIAESDIAVTSKKA